MEWGGGGGGECTTQEKMEDIPVVGITPYYEAAQSLKGLKEGLLLVLILTELGLVGNKETALSITAPQRWNLINDF